MIATLFFLVQAMVLPDSRAAMAAGDDSFFRIDYRPAIEAYESALRMEPDQPDILWRLARVYVCLGEVAEADQRSSLFKEAEGYARRCIAADSTRWEGYTWLAGALGYLAYYAGTGEQVRLSHEILRIADLSLLWNHNNDAAYSIKGSLYRALGNVGWLQKQLAMILYGRMPVGGFEEGEAALKRAIEIAPDVMRHHYELGVLYLDWEKNAEAMKELERAASLPVLVAIDRPRLEKTRLLLKTLSAE